MPVDKYQKKHKKNNYMYGLDLNRPDKFVSLRHPKASAHRDCVRAEPILYAPRWRWSGAVSPPPPVLGEAPQCHPLDILGVFDPPLSAASVYCKLPDAALGTTERTTREFGAPPFAVLLSLLAACEAGSTANNGPCSKDESIRIGLFGPGAAAARQAAKAISPEAESQMIDLHAVRGAPDDPGRDPLPRGMWPVLCPAYLPDRSAPASHQMPLDRLPVHSPHQSRQWRALTTDRTHCSNRRVLMSICADDAEASYLPPDVRRRVTALPRLMNRLYVVLSDLNPLYGPNGQTEGFGSRVGARFSDEMAETAFELAMVARAHLIAFYARVRPAHTGPIHRAAAAMLRHRPLRVSPTTLSSGISGGDLRVLEAAGWLEPRDEETDHGFAHRFTPSDAFWEVDIADLPKKWASHPNPVDVLCDGPFSPL